MGVSLERRHRFSKAPVDVIRLLGGLGVEGDAHAGATVQHRSRKRWRPDLPNLRQVHVLHAELHEEFAAAGFAVGPGDLGENILTAGLDLLSLPTGTVLRFGAHAEVEVTGLRNPCVQIDRFAPGLLERSLGRDSEGNLVRKTGVMGIVMSGGEVRPGDPITMKLPAKPHHSLKPV